MRNYHITYFIERGNPEEGIRPLVGGKTLEALEKHVNLDIDGDGKMG